jgi:Tol biopolymer transport system component
LAGTEGAQYPFWSPDSRSIGFFASGKLYRIDIEGGRPRAVADAPVGRGGTWNRDGVIVFAPTATSPLMRVPASGGEPVPLAKLDAPERSRSHRFPQFLPDGRWVAYATNESGQYQVVVQPFPEPAGKWQISTGAGQQPRWRADGRELYFIAPDGKLMAAAVTASGRTFSSATPVALFQTRIVGRGSSIPPKSLYAVSRDGRFLILQAAEEATLSPITLFLNWKP